MEVAAAQTVAPPVASGLNTSFYTFCRANWPIFVVSQTLALVGAGYAGYVARTRRLELETLNKQLRDINAANRARDLPRLAESGDALVEAAALATAQREYDEGDLDACARTLEGAAA